jgi:hypothetical protein
MLLKLTPGGRNWQLISPHLLEKMAWDKLSGLSRKIVNYGCKKIYNVRPRGSSVVEHSPHHFKVDGSSPSAAQTGKENIKSFITLAPDLKATFSGPVFSLVVSHTKVTLDVALLLTKQPSLL